MSTEQSTPPTGPTPASSAPGPSAAAMGTVPTAPMAAKPSRHERRHRALGPSQRAEASGQLVPMSLPGARRIAGWLFWVVFPLLCLGAIWVSAENFAHHVGKKPIGYHGTFVVQPRSCTQGFCSFGGLFTSEDGKIRNLPLIGDPRWQPGEVRPVTYDPTGVEVIPLPGHWDPTPSVLSTLGAVTYLVVVGYFYRAERRVRTA